jgi:glutamate transport system permease protein
VPALIVIALLMISVNIALSAAATWLERRLRRSRRAPEPVKASAIAIEPGD